VGCSSQGSAKGTYAQACARVSTIEADFQRVLADPRVGTDPPDAVDAHFKKAIDDTQQAIVLTEPWESLNGTLGDAQNDLRALRRTSQANRDLTTTLSSTIFIADDLQQACFPSGSPSTG
jgi:hypothetical protein